MSSQPLQECNAHPGDEPGSFEGAREPQVRQGKIVLRAILEPDGLLCRYVGSILDVFYHDADLAARFGRFKVIAEELREFQIVSCFIHQLNISRSGYGGLGNSACDQR